MAHLTMSPVHALSPRQTDGSTSAGDQLLDLIGGGPVSTKLGGDTLVVALAIYLPLTVVIYFLFCFLRPHNNIVYAPRAKYADSKHAPPPISKGLFDWIGPVVHTKEPELAEKLGLDAVIFLRVVHMLRNIFLILTLLGCGILIPLVVIGTRSFVGKVNGNDSWYIRMTPTYVYGATQLLWGYIVVAYLFAFTIYFFLWINYRAVLRLRRAHFNDPEYLRSLHARTLLLTDLPKAVRSDEGIVRLTEELRATSSTPRAAVARNVKDLPHLVEEHEQAVRDLEKVLAKYLKNPDRLPPNRPTCKPARGDKAYPKGQKTDAIDYLTHRIKQLEIEIKQVRESVDKRNALSYGFASYEHISDAHTAAYVARKGGPSGTLIRLAPRPNDLVWKNLKMSKKERSWQNVINNIWTVILTVVWVGPNIMIAVFLSNLSNLGVLWPGFEQQLLRHPKWWAIVQAVAAPALTILFYYYLPAIFRKLCIKAGDLTKTSRERHVMQKLYSFFVFNQFIIFSVFSAAFGYVVKLVRESEQKGFEEAFKGSEGFKSFWGSLIGVSPYWCSWLLQRNLGAVIDLSQLVSLSWGSISRKWLSPTPRERIQLTAPQPFEYASYYNYLLLYSTVAICFAPIQPLVLPIVALYFSLDVVQKKYLLMYVFITKYESDGMFWTSIVNRVLFTMLLSYVVTALQILATVYPLGAQWGKLVALAPLFIMVPLFKWYCARSFDTGIRFHSTGKALLDNEFSAETEHKQRKGDRVGVRFGNPVLYKPLMTPMVSAKSQHLLKQIYQGRLEADQHNVAGFSDVYMDSMDANKPGKSASPAPFEFVGENQMDFENFKNRAEFREAAGGDGQLFGRAQDIVRSGTPSTMLTRTATTDSFESHRMSGAGYHSRDMSGDSDVTRVGDGMEYPRGYHQMPTNLRDQSPAGSEASYEGGRHVRYGSGDNRSREGLVTSAANMGLSNPTRFNPYSVNPSGYAPVGGTPLGATPTGTPGEDDTSYDYFRRGRQRY